MGTWFRRRYERRPQCYRHLPLAGLVTSLARVSLWDENQPECYLVRPFGWSEIKNPFAAGVSEFPGAARDSAGACRAWDVDEGPLTSDVTFWQRSYDRAAESCGRGIDQRASPVCAPDLAARIASEEYVLGEDVEVSGGRSRRTDIHEVVDGSGSGDDVNLLWIGRRPVWRTRGCPGCVRRDGKYSQTKTEDNSTPSDQQRFTHDYLPVAEQPISISLASLCCPINIPLPCPSNASTPVPSASRRSRRQWRR